jgi:hypothetical protein
LGKRQEAWPVCGVAIAWADGNAHKYSFIVSVSVDGTSFTKVFSGKSSGTSNLTEIYHFPQSIARYIRVMVTQSTPGVGTSIAQISELSIIGTP